MGSGKGQAKRINKIFESANKKKQRQIEELARNGVDQEELMKTLHLAKGEGVISQTYSDLKLHKYLMTVLIPAMHEMPSLQLEAMEFLDAAKQEGYSWMNHFDLAAVAAYMNDINFGSLLDKECQENGTTLKAIRMYFNSSEGWKQQLYYDRIIKTIDKKISQEELLKETARKSKAAEAVRSTSDKELKDFIKNTDISF